MLLIVGGVWLLALEAHPEEFFLPETAHDSIIGELRWTKTREGQSLLDIARAFDVGHDQLLSANPHLNRWVPPVGADVLIPSRYILPPGPRHGIVLNLAELRLYYYPPRSGTVLTYPVSIGDINWKTPRGTTSIVAKEIDPAWSPTASIRREHREEGDELPAVIPGGSEDNPLGHYALKLGIPSYLIHGTNEARAFGIGMRVSHGCIRLYPEDIEDLFYSVAIGTTVRIIDAPIKIGWRGEFLYLEVHRPFEVDERLALPEPSWEDLETLLGYSLRDETRVDSIRTLSVFERGNGIPVPIGIHMTVPENDVSTGHPFVPRAPHQEEDLSVEPTP